jgi:hypothetical protein
MPTAKYAPKQRVLCGRGSSAEWCSSRFLGCVFFPIVHLLHELLRLFLVDKRQACQAFFQLKRVKEGPVLVVVPGVVDLLIPYHTSVSRL